jgi:hypothetical protein
MCSDVLNKFCTTVVRLECSALLEYSATSLCISGGTAFDTFGVFSDLYRRIFIFCGKSTLKYAQSWLSLTAYARFWKQ